MLKVTLEQEGYVLTDVTNLAEVQAVLDGTSETSSCAIYLQDRNTDDPVKATDLDSDQASKIMAMLEEEGLLKILDEDAEAAQNANNRLEDESILAQMAEGESRNPWSVDDSVFGMEMGDFMDEAEVVPTKEDKIEILQAASSDLLDSIYEMRLEAKKFIEMLDELLDPDNPKAQNAMARAVQAVGADMFDHDSGAKEVQLGFQQAQMDHVTEATMWAAAAIVGTE